MPKGENMPVVYDQEINLLDVFLILWKKKFFILTVTFIAGVLGVIYVLFIRVPTYRGVSRVLASGSNSVSSFSGLGELAGMLGVSTGKSSPGQMLISIVRGETVLDAVIDKFNLMEKYEATTRAGARNAVLSNMDAEEAIDSGGITTIAYRATEPEFAAMMANALVEELQKKLQDIAIEDAQQRRNFFETQLRQSEQELTEAEEAIINYQQSKGLVAFESQTQALLASMNSLKNQIAAKNVEISTLSSYTKKDNPRLKLAQSQLDAMNKELHRLEEQQLADSRRNSAISGDLLSSVSQIPEMGIEYQHYVRTLRFATAKYETMLRQYETAKLGEVNDLSTIFIVDRATVPDEEYNRRRSMKVALFTATGFLMSVLITFLTAHIQELLKEREEQDDDDEF